MLAQDIFEKLEGLGAAALFVLAVLYMVFHHLRKSKTEDATNSDIIAAISDHYMLLIKRLDEIHRLTADLYKWHDKDDPSTGAKVWYVQQGLQHSIEGLNKNLIEQTKILSRLLTTSEKTNESVNELKKHGPG